MVATRRGSRCIPHGLQGNKGWELFGEVWSRVSIYIITRKCSLRFSPVESVNSLHYKCLNYVLRRCFYNQIERGIFLHCQLNLSVDESRPKGARTKGRLHWRSHLKTTISGRRLKVFLWKFFTQELHFSRIAQILGNCIDLTNLAVFCSRTGLARDRKYLRTCWGVTFSFSLTWARVKRMVYLS